MKEKYFTLENIDHESENFLSLLKNNGVKDKFSFCPEKSALLILDMQRFFLDKSSHAYIPTAEVIIPNIQSLLKLYLNAGQPVILTRHLNSSDNAGLMKIWWKDTIKENNIMSEISPDIQNTETYLINKSQYDAFYNTDLENYLTKNKISQLVVTGIMTHLCCETTIRSAFVRGFETFFPIDATATYNFEFHRSTFINLSHGFTMPVIVKDLKENMEKSKVAST